MSNRARFTQPYVIDHLAKRAWRPHGPPAVREVVQDAVDFAIHKALAAVRKAGREPAEIRITPATPEPIAPLGAKDVLIGYVHVESVPASEVMPELPRVETPRPGAGGGAA